MTGQELQEALASGAIKMVKGRYVSTISEKMDYGPVRKLKSTTDATPLEPVKIKTNVRVKNATKTISDNIKFDSKLEAYMYSLLKGKGFDVELQYVVELQPGFRGKDGKAIIAIKWKADFFIPHLGLIIDTKGWGTEIFKLKLKLFKYLQFKGSYPEIKKLEFPKNKAECMLLSVSLK